MSVTFCRSLALRRKCQGRDTPPNLDVATRMGCLEGLSWSVDAEASWLPRREGLCCWLRRPSWSCERASEQRQRWPRLTHLPLRHLGRRRCWYALISTKLPSPKCWVSERASINCLLNSLLPWFSSVGQSVCVSHSGLVFRREACAFCRNQLLFPTDQLFKSMDRLSCIFGFFLFFFFAALLAWMEI